jgi:hypothetical protein
MERELINLKRLYPIESEEYVYLKEKDIDSLSLLLFSDASYEYITYNLLSKRKFNILKRVGVFKTITSNNSRITYKVSSEYENQVRNIYIKYYRMKFNKLV